MRGARGASPHSRGAFLLTCSQYLLGGRGWSQGCSHLRFPLLMFDVPLFWSNVTICPFLGSFLIVLCSIGFCRRCWHLPVPQGFWRNRASCGLLVCFFCPHLLSLCFSVLVHFGLLFGIHLRDHNRLFRGLGFLFQQLMGPKIKYMTHLEITHKRLKKLMCVCIYIHTRQSRLHILPVGIVQIHFQTVGEKPLFTFLCVTCREVILLVSLQCISDAHFLIPTKFETLVLHLKYLSNEQTISL